MKFRLPVIAAAFIILLSSNSFGQALVSFTQGTFVDNSVLALAGPASQVHYAVDFGNDSTPVTTANGYTFDTWPNPNVTNLGTLNLNIFMDGYAGLSDDLDFNSVLNTALFSFGNNTFTLNNLVIGQEYNTLFLVTDVRAGGGNEIPGRTFSVTSGAASSATQVYAFLQGIPNTGGYVMGTFTATDVTQSFVVSAPDGMLNAMVVVAVPEPAVAVMVAIGLGALVVVRRKNGYPNLI